MDKDFIIITEYCTYSSIDPKFVILLEDEGLISTVWIDGEQYISDSQIAKVERYAHWHYELDINIEGIDTIQRLLLKIELMQKEMDQLKKRIGIDTDSITTADDYFI